ncbi:MAG: Fe-S cluster assembly protein SufD [Vulcanimicrobiaceae bacterium]
MSGNADVTVVGVGKDALAARLVRYGDGSIPAGLRYDALARFEELPVRGGLRGGRTWKHDLAKLDFSSLATYDAADTEADVEVSPGARRAGVIVERFSLARERHRVAFERAFGRALDTRDDKFASLALAFASSGVFIEVPPGIIVDEPLVVGYDARETALFPYTLVSLGEGARATVVERIAGGDAAPLLCGLVELVLASRARLTYAVDQRLSKKSRLIVTRRAALADDAQIDVSFAELGGQHVVSRFRATASGRGSRAGVVALFFSDGDQHVDIETETVHAAADTRSETIVRSAGTDRGQGRYLGNIKILADAHGADASLRDDALLLSPGAHIDSVPALEIAANDVKAFHGATVGAISEEEIFYAESRGIARDDAERMIALGFFEPAVARFPLGDMRDGIRTALENKIASKTVLPNV